MLTLVKLIISNIFNFNNLSGRLPGRQGRQPLHSLLQGPESQVSIPPAHLNGGMSKQFPDAIDVGTALGRP
jgi:hypothetical protein